jgi:hypothetical protein
LEACGPAGDAAAERITLYFSTEIDQFIETKYSVFVCDSGGFESNCGVIKAVN